jgi:hypothetical protein
MVKKNFLLMSLSILALVFFLAFTSATITLTDQSISLSNTSASGSITITGNGNFNITNVFPVTQNDALGKIKFTLTNTTSLNNVTSATFLISAQELSTSEFLEDYQKIFTFTAQNASNSADNSTFRVTANYKSSNFCESTNAGDLDVTIKDVTVTSGFGENNEWFVFDEIEVELLVENNGDEDVDNVVVEWGLYNTQSETWTIELTEENDFNLNNGDEETVMLSFSINNNLDEDLQDLEEGDYILYVRATGEVSGGTYDGDDTCSSDSETNNLMLERDFVVLNKLLTVPETIQCGSEVQISGDVWNIGARDQDGVYVIVYNKELKINEKVEIGTIDSFDSSDFNFNLQLPKDILEKKYYLTLTVYDEDDDVYENGNNDQAMFSVALDVKGSCSSAEASVTAGYGEGFEKGGQAISY